jgi:hypothetical protein
MHDKSCACTNQLKLKIPQNLMLFMTLSPKQLLRRRRREMSDDGSGSGLRRSRMHGERKKPAP